MRSIYLAKLKLLSFQGLICVTPMEGPGGGLMRHKMMINEFIGRCSSNKGSELAYTSGAWRRRSTQLGFSLRVPAPTRVFPRAQHWMHCFTFTQDASCGRSWTPDSEVGMESGGSGRGERVLAGRHRPLRAGCSSLGQGSGTEGRGHRSAEASGIPR